MQGQAVLPFAFELEGDDHPSLSMSISSFIYYGNNSKAKPADEIIVGCC